MADDLNSRLNALLSDPSALQQIMSIASNVVGSEKSQTQSQPSAFSDVPTRSEEQQNFNISARDRIDERCELLNALKPFLRGRRADRIELMIRLLQFSKFMGRS